MSFDSLNLLSELNTKAIEYSSQGGSSQWLCSTPASTYGRNTRPNHKNTYFLHAPEGPLNDNWHIFMGACLRNAEQYINTYLASILHWRDLNCSTNKNSVSKGSLQPFCRFGGSGPNSRDKRNLKKSPGAAHIIVKIEQRTWSHFGLEESRRGLAALHACRAGENSAV